MRYGDERPQIVRLPQIGDGISVLQQIIKNAGADKTRKVLAKGRFRHLKRHGILENFRAVNEAVLLIFKVHRKRKGDFRNFRKPV